MPVDQAIFTSLTRQGKSGYHVVARSAGVTDSEAHALATWSPSHGGLLIDDFNALSVNYFPLPSGRIALARTREGRGEYTGRGRQIFTRALFLDPDRLRWAKYNPFAIYRDALTLGHLYYTPTPPKILPQLQLSSLRPRPESFPEDNFETGQGIEATRVETIVSQLEAGHPVLLAHDGDRVRLAERVIRRVSPEIVSRLSFSTSLKPSTVRPFQFSLVAKGIPVG